MGLFWIFAFVFFLLIEALTVTLTCLWFAVGSLAALIVQVVGAGFVVQFASFAVASGLCLLLFRPLALRFTDQVRKKNGAGRFIGCRVIVKERIDNRAGTGSVLLFGQVWLARSAVEGETIKEQEVCEVTAVRGARLYVRPVREEKAV